MTVRLGWSDFRCSRLGLCVLLLVLLLPGFASAQERGSRSNVSMRGSLGMTAGPETFNMTLEVPFVINPMFSAGPLLQLGFSDDDTLFGASANAYWTPRLEDSMREWHPYVHVGMGFMYVEDDNRRPGRDDEDADFLITTGTGIEYELSESFLLGTGLLFDVIPGGAAGEHFIFGWQVLTMRVAF